MGPNNVRGRGNRPLKAAANISKGMLCKATSTADSVTPCTADTDAALYVAQEDVASGDTGTFAPFEPGVEHRLLPSANVAAGAKLGIDASNAGKVKTITTGTGIAVALDSGTYAAGLQLRCMFWLTPATA